MVDIIIDDKLQMIRVEQEKLKKQLEENNQLKLKLELKEQLEKLNEELESELKEPKEKLEKLEKLKELEKLELQEREMHRKLEELDKLDKLDLQELELEQKLKKLGNMFQLLYKIKILISHIDKIIEGGQIKANLEENNQLKLELYEQLNKELENPLKNLDLDKLTKQYQDLNNLYEKLEVDLLLAEIKTLIVDIISLKKSLKELNNEEETKMNALPESLKDLDLGMLKRWHGDLYDKWIELLKKQEEVDWEMLKKEELETADEAKLLGEESSQGYLDMDNYSLLLDTLLNRSSDSENDSWWNGMSKLDISLYLYSNIEDEYEKEQPEDTENYFSKMLLGVLNELSQENNKLADLDMFELTGLETVDETESEVKPVEELNIDLNSSCLDIDIRWNIYMELDTNDSFDLQHKLGYISILNESDEANLLREDIETLIDNIIYLKESLKEFNNEDEKKYPNELESEKPVNQAEMNKDSNAIPLVLGTFALVLVIVLAAKFLGDADAKMDMNNNKEITHDTDI